MLNSQIQERIEKNRYRILKDSAKIAVYPYGVLGKQVTEVLDKRFHVTPDYIVDNSCSHPACIRFEAFMRLYREDTIILFSTEKRTVFLTLLETMMLAGVNSQNIVVIPIHQLLSYEALEKIINDFSHRSVLDIGCGQGLQGRMMQDYGKEVTGITMSKEKGYDGRCLSNVLCTDFLDFKPKEKYDIVWASHILEHVVDVEGFLRKMKDVVAADGCLAVTVPKETSILLPHIHTFSAGRLLRYMLCAGYDCKNAEILEYGYNISVVLPNVKFIHERYDIENFINESSNTTGADKIFEYLPEKIDLKKSWDNIYYFHGEIRELNWDKSSYTIYL